MPDQSSAAQEHSLLQQITEPLASLPEDSVHFGADAEFPTALRGYDKYAVDEYVRRTGRLIDELQSRSSPQAAVRRALERVGEDVSGILQRAHETAEEITTSSRREAEDRLQQSRREASDLIDAAEGRVKELDGDTDRIWEERERIVADARELASQLTELADAAAARFTNAAAVDETAVIARAPNLVDESEPASHVADEPGTDEFVVEPPEAEAGATEIDFDDEPFESEDGSDSEADAAVEFARESTDELPELGYGEDEYDPSLGYEPDGAEVVAEELDADDPAGAPLAGEAGDGGDLTAPEHGPSSRVPFDLEAPAGEGHALPGSDTAETTFVDPPRGGITARRMY